MSPDELLNILIDCYSYQDYQLTFDTFLESGHYPDVTKLSQLDRIDFFLRKKKIQIMLAEMDNINFKPFLSIEHLECLKRMAQFGKEETPITIKINTQKETMLDRINKLL